MTQKSFFNRFIKIKLLFAFKNTSTQKERIVKISEVSACKKAGIMGDSKQLVPVECVESSILFMRGEKVIIDSDLARLYGVSTKRLNEQVKRNKGRFPPDFVFQLTSEEKAEVVANCDHLMSIKFSKGLPIAFTEHGAVGRVCIAHRITKEKRAAYA